MSSVKYFRRRSISESVLDTREKVHKRKTSWAGEHSMNIISEDQDGFYGYGYKCQCVPSASSHSVGSMIYEGKACACGNTKIYSEQIYNNVQWKPDNDQHNTNNNPQQRSLKRNNSDIKINKEILSNWTPFNQGEHTKAYQRRQLQSIPIQMRPLPPLPPEAGVSVRDSFNSSSKISDTIDNNNRRKQQKVVDLKTGKVTFYRYK